MKSFTEFINEGRGFELGGSKYSSGFGRYTKDGKSISKEEYMKASAEYKGGKVSSNKNDTKVVEKKPYYTPSSEEIENRNIPPKVSHNKKDGTFEVELQVNPKYNRGRGGESIKFFYKDYMNDWYKEFNKDMDDAEKRLGSKTPRDNAGVFKFWMKHGPAKDLENLLNISITTDTEREKIFNKFLDVVFTYIDDNFDKISKS